MADYNPFNLDEFLKGPPGEVPVAPAPGINPAATSRLPWYNRPLPLPPWLSKVGRGAKVLGRASVPVGIGLTLGGGYVEGINIAANAIAGGPTVEGTVARGKAGFGAVPAAPVVVPEKVQLDTTGPTFQPPFVPERGAEPSGPPRDYGNPAGNFMSALIGLKQIAGDAAQKTARQKLYVDSITKGASVRKDLAEAFLAEGRGAEYARAKKAGATPAELAALLSTSGGAGESFTGFPTMEIGGPVDVLQTRGPGAGAIRRVTPKPEITESQIKDTMKKRGMTREQVIARLQEEGRM